MTKYINIFCHHVYISFKEKLSCKLLTSFMSTTISSWSQTPQAKTNIREKEKQILDKILQPNLYDRRIRPSGANGTGT